MNRSMQDREDLGMEIHSMSIGASLVMYAGFAVQEKKKERLSPEKSGERTVSTGTLLAVRNADA